MIKMDSQTISDKKNHDQSVQPREYCLMLYDINHYDINNTAQFSINQQNKQNKHNCHRICKHKVIKYNV